MSGYGITFDGEAFDAMVRVASLIPSGWTVALLPEGEDVGPDGGIEVGVDVQFVSADECGVIYLPLDEHGDVLPHSGLLRRPWDHIARIHIY